MPISTETRPFRFSFLHCLVAFPIRSSADPDISPHPSFCTIFTFYLLGFSYYASTTFLSPGFYENLLNRGWRRSGSLLYKPDQLASCCPQYTIRLDSHLFHASKDQRQALNRFNKHILGDSYIKDAARLYPRSHDQAKKRNVDFDLVERVHEAEKEYLRWPPEPIDPPNHEERAETIPPEPVSYLAAKPNKGASKAPSAPSHSLTVTLESDDFTEEKYAVFENYQRLVHHEPPHRISKPGFKNFLCSSPLPRIKETFDGRERRLGSYHQCYRIDGILIAVGVLDLLPQCVSAVYFMYHESVHQHGFGKLGALREIALAKEEGYRWWYAGFYIHSCIKMRYKGDYTPQYMLDPASYNWDLLDDVMKKKLDIKKYVSLSSERAASATEAETEGDQHAGEVDPATIDTAKDSNLDPVVNLNEEQNSAVEEAEPSNPDNNLNEDQDSDDDGPVPNPETPLFARSIPGVLTREQLLTEIDLDHIRLRIRDTEAETSDLVSWDTSDMDNVHSLKGIIADLVAAVGSEAAREMVVHFN